MAVITEGGQVVRGISTGFAALFVVDMEFDPMTVLTAALAGIAVSPEHILPDVVAAKHLTLLVILSLRNGLASGDSFEQLQVKLSCFHNYLADRQQSACPADCGDVFLNLDFHGGSQPTSVLAVDSVIESGFPVAGLAVPPGLPELPSSGQIVNHIVAGSDLGSKHFLTISSYR